MIERICEWEIFDYQYFTVITKSLTHPITNKTPMIIFVVILAIIFIIISSTWLKLHPLAGLLIAALGVGIFTGLPVDKLAETIGKGFGELMSKIGLMVILGCVIGAILDKSGAAIKVAVIILNLFW